MESEKMTDAILLKYLMYKNGDTVADLAAHLGIERATLSAKINNRSEFKQGEMLKIAVKYALSPETCKKVFMACV